ncbi:MAG: aldehyde dehydrogenase family protein [Burkholderiaceae bacterium]
MKQWDHYINGVAVKPAGGAYLAEYDPRTGEESQMIAQGNIDDVNAAVASAQEALPAWRSRRPIERGRILMKIAHKIREHSAKLTHLDQSETGRSAAASAADIETAAQYFEFYAGLVNIGHGTVIDLGSSYHSYTRHEPFGVVGIILPWNAPLNQAGRGLGPALATGNTVVAKPSEFTSATLLELARIAVEECDLPAGVLNVVTGLGPEVGAALVEHKLIRKVSFTGSVRTGQVIGRLAADRIIPVGLELGGKSPNIIFADADLDQAVPGSMKAFLFNAGQACSSGSRCLVHRSVHDEFVQRLKQELEKVQVGSGDGAMVGPIITRAQFDKVQSYCRDAEAEGATAHVTGVLQQDAEKAGWYVRPVVITGVHNDMQIAREEIFGPVLAIIPFDDDEEAIRIANDTDYGLVAGIWTTDLSRAHRVAALLEAGQVFINEYYAGGVETPFGGYKQSGYGREKGLEAMAHYVQVKCVTAKL